jgi:hypothetical protein
MPEGLNRPGFPWATGLIGNMATPPLQRGELSALGSPDVVEIPS